MQEEATEPLGYTLKVEISESLERTQRGVTDEIGRR